MIFGDPDNVYELIDDAAPRASATAADGERREAHGAMLSLPDEQDVACTLYRDGATWYLEMPPHERRSIASGDALTVAGRVWSLDLPLVLEDTAAQAMELKELTLRFRVSRDEEHAELVLDDGTASVALPSRAYWYTLLTMARRRRQDVACGICEADAGWMDVEELVGQLKSSIDTINHHVLRARRALSQARVHGYTRIVERRRSPSRIRLGSGKIDIVVQ